MFRMPWNPFCGFIVLDYIFTVLVKGRLFRIIFFSFFNFRLRKCTQLDAFNDSNCRDRGGRELFMWIRDVLNISYMGPSIGYHGILCNLIVGLCFVTQMRV